MSSEAPTDRERAPSEAPVPERFGNYRVVRRLGRGGMGSVYLAVHEQIERQVAIKVLRSDLAKDPAIARRFLNEARAVNLIKHPGLVQITDHGEADGTPFIVMEYLEGVSLGSYVRVAGGKLREREAMRLIADIAAALAAAHDGGVVHRDLKPENVMLVRGDDPSRAAVKILDFGIAKAPSDSGPPLTIVDAVMGTPAYMAPEQWRSARDVDGRADVYALGVMLYQMLSGQLPFAGATMAAQKALHLDEPPPSLRGLVKDLSPAVEQLVGEMLAKVSSDRPTMREVEEAANARLQGTPRNAKAKARANDGRVGGGDVIDGRFEIERLASAGGMGEVFRARDRETGNHVALKLVRNGDPMHFSRFEREARALAQLQHPAIVRYIAHGSDPVFLAMEWLEGHDLAQRLASGPLSIVEALQLTRIVADALLVAHVRGIVHRDIKPSNIFLQDGRIESAKVLDFGIAQVTQSTRAITGTGQLLGTLGYMAPEQALSGRNVTTAVDVYSLGCVLYECVAGQGPFAGEWQQVLSKILVSEPPRLREVKPDAPLALEDLIIRMMKRDPKARASLETVTADIATFLTGGETLRSGGVGTSTVPAVTGDERRLVAVIVTDTPLLPKTEPGTLLAAADTLASSAPSIASVVGRFGGELVMRPDGATLVTLSAGTGGADLAARAAQCALAVRRAAPGVRIALASGRGDPERDTLVTEIVERAWRLLSASNASEDHVHIDASTAGLLDAAFIVRASGAELVLVGENEQRGARKLLGRPTPCVGRERDLTMLTGLATECFDESLSTAIVITGEPGVGKSRVRHELVRTLHERENAPEVWSARGDAIAVGSPFAMLGQLLRRLAKLDEGEPVEMKRQKLLTRVGRHLAVADAVRVAELFGDLVRAEFSADDRPALRAARQDPASMADQLRRAWEDFIAAECAAGPIAIVLEDLQWGDLPTIRLIDAALRSERHRPLLVISVARPEVHEAFPGLFRDRRVHEVRLAELTPSAARKLVLDVLGPDTPPNVVDTLVERSHGNPFYLEELIRSIAEGDSALPETVLASTQARLQRLDPGARRVLRAASVFGVRFWLSGVAALVKGDAESEVKPTLAALVQREILLQQPTSRFPGDVEYVFRHGLVRDAAYEMLTHRDRLQAHALAADWIEVNGERDALVHAEHLERSGERQRAVVWYLWAAEQALEASDIEGVLLRAERGIQCGAAGSVLGELTLLQAEASGWAGLDTHFELAESALALLPSGGSAWTRAAAELAVACRSRANAELLRQTAAAVAAAPLEATSLLPALARARIVVELLGAGHAELAGKLVTAIEGALSSAEEDDAPTLRLILSWLRGAESLYAGSPGVLLDRASAIADAFEADGNARWAALVALHATIGCAVTRDATSGIAWAERAGKLARRLGIRSCEVRARAWLAFHLADIGHAEAAITTAQSAVRDAGSDQVTEGEARVALAYATLAGVDAMGARDQSRELLKPLLLVNRT